MSTVGGFRVAALALVLWTAVAGEALAADAPRKPAGPGKTWQWTFEADTLGLPPNATRTSGPGWSVLEDSTEAGAGRILRQSESDEGIGFHLVQFSKPLLANQEVSTRVRIRSGEIDPSVGIAFQLDAKGKNGYVVRLSGKRRQLIAHYLLNGKRRDLKYAKVDPPEPGTWHTLAVRRVGHTMEVRFDGELKMKLRDERFSSGNVGLWTEDDTVADFRDLNVTSL